MSSIRYLKNGKYNFNQNDVLGSGSFGKVYRGFNNQKSHQVALKQIGLDKLEIYGDEMKEIICNEITVMRKFGRKMLQLPCPYLVRHEDCFRTEKFIYIAMQICQAGSLLQYSFKKKLPQLQAVNILYQIVQGLKYFSDLGMVHRDLKPENIFVKKEIINGAETRVYKIGDFGFAAHKKNLSTTMGTYPYMAPQVFKKQQYGTKADVWAVGVIAHQILFDQIYFMGKDKWEIAKNIKEKPYQLTEQQVKLVKQQTIDFIRRCLQKDQTKRITPSEMVDHPIFKHLRKTEVKNNVLTDIYNILEKCRNLYRCAQMFADYSHSNKRQTQFVQVYLLKESYINLNRLTYSIMYKQNHLLLSNEDFEYLIKEVPSAEYQKLNQNTQQECVLVTTLFNAKYKEFTSYISKFPLQDRQLIEKVVTEEPYTPVHPQVYREQILKWIQTLRTQKDWQKLYDLCVMLNP